jgi:putative endonuclease
MWFVYIVKCRNKSLYTGITNDIDRRLKAHNSGRGGSYTKAFGPVRLVWKERKKNKSYALKREIQIKNLKRAEKEVLIGKGKSN